MLMMLTLGKTARRLTCTINPNKTLTIHAVGNVLGSMPCLMPFLGVFDLSWSQSSQNGVPIVLMMLLYEARALRAFLPIRSISRAGVGLVFG